jgi:hypothetical protein
MSVCSTDFLAKTLLQMQRICDFALPDDDQLPTSFPKPFLRRTITQDILVKLALPKVDPAFGRVRKFAAKMTMPKATVNKDRRFMLSKNNVGIPRQFLIMNSKPVSHSMQ